MEVSPRFHQGCASFVISLVFWGYISLGLLKGSAKGFPITYLNLSASSSTLFAFFPNSVSFGVFSHSKGLGAKYHVCLLWFFAANGFRLPKGSFECSPNSSFFGKWLLLQKRFCGGLRQLFFTFVTQMAVAS